LLPHAAPGAAAVDRPFAALHLAFVSDQKPYSSFRDLASRLPFEIDDLDSVNDLFVAFRNSPDRTIEVQIEVWTYCFVRRYFSMKLSRDGLARGADLDALMDLAYHRIRGRRLEVRDRYGSWVSVVCRNAFLNYVRDRKAFVDVSDPVEEFRPEKQSAETDYAIAVATVDGAISRLPAYLQTISRLRILEDLEYEEIADAVGRPVAIVRAYFHKAVLRLRADPAVRAVLGKSKVSASDISVLS
jgi:DNA-directed RNA polymerase specialized sigma24 family protein